VYARLVELAKVETPDVQKILTAQVILMRTGEYKYSLQKWLMKLLAEQTWEGVMDFFRFAQQQQSKTCPTLRDISMETNVIQKLTQLEKALNEIQVDNEIEEEQESLHNLLKTMLLQNKTQMDEMKKLWNQQKDKGGELKAKQLCQKCKDNGMGKKMHMLHCTKDCRKYPAKAATGTN